MPKMKKDAPVIDDIQDEGVIIQLAKDVGVGIDCHSEFLQVSVIVRNASNYIEYQKRFNTDPESIDKAHEWVIQIIETRSDPPIIVNNETLSYTIESTSSYHLPLVQRWGGVPEIINPKLAGAGRRKTDKIDSDLLSRQNINGTWIPSYVPSQDVWTLRSLIGRREAFNENATRISNQINNTFLKFGITIGRNGSVTKNAEIRAIASDLISDHPSDSLRNLYPIDIPTEVKALLQESYKQYDEFKNHELEYAKLSVDKAKSMMWETSTSMLCGEEMLQLLTTVPGVGVNTALIWLANIITPRRFPNQKAVAAYCGLDPSLKISAEHVVSTVKRGGNKDLHRSLCFSASNLMKHHSEPMGIWGFKLYQATGKWKKGTNAVGRRIALALFYVQSKGLAFDYSKYTFLDMPVVIDISIDELAAINPDFHRYIRWLKDANINFTQDLSDKFHNGVLQRSKGLGGKKLIGLVKDFINSQQQYELLYAEYSKRKNLIMKIVEQNPRSIDELKEEYVQFQRYVPTLIRQGILTNKDLICEFYNNKLLDHPRLGIVFQSVVDDYISWEISKNKKES